MNRKARLARELALAGNNYEITLTQLPEVPKDFQERLKNIGGVHSATGNPILRCVSGLAFDENNQIFAAEQWRRKYVGARDHVQEIIGYKVINKETQEDNFLSVGDAKRIILDSNMMPKPEVKEVYAVIPMLKFYETEYGIPRYVIERYAAAEEFGGTEDWEKNRWLDIGDPLNPHPERPFDLLGSYPREGRYVFLTYVEHGVEENGVIVRTEYRELDDSVLDEVAELITHLREQSAKSTEQRIRESEERLENERDQKINTLRDEVKDILKARVLYENQPTVTVKLPPQETVAQLANQAKERAAAMVAATKKTEARGEAQ